MDNREIENGDKPEMSLKQKCANEECSQQFIPKRPQHKYCSKKCKNQGWHTQHPNYFHDRYLTISTKIKENLKKSRSLKIGTAVKVNGVWVPVWLDAPNKRPRPSCCELCGVPFKPNNYAYHHWDDSDPSKGIWVCKTDHIIVNTLDKIPDFANRYFKLKEKMELVFIKK